MYNPLLNTFIAVADLGSFNRAAEQLFISPTAVMKQMNQLEMHLGFKLIDRTASGTELTPAGKLIYNDSKFIIDYSAKSITAARALVESYDTTFCIGSSLLNPAKPFMDLWYNVNQYFPDYKIHLVPFDDCHCRILSEIALLGKKYDFLIGVCDSSVWMSLANYLPIGLYKKMIAVRRDHPLASKKKLRLSDLDGYTLMMVPAGESEINDSIRKEIVEKHPKITIEDTNRYYDAAPFNRAAETGNLLLSTECWSDIHPGLVTLPVDWNYSIPYGILYSLNPPDDIVKFIDIVRRTVDYK